ncbi:hypothetical protein [Aggregatibacter kilianii]|uniref:hypothetical protein n=1 Tax=Aggregatibacter kilianii TaxID=2025884 RepID=UPI000D68ED7B|nr:hypothetical protein [Aggregatibacter kilianii]
MECTQSIQSKALNAKHFPKEAFYLFHELDSILNIKKHGVLIAKNYPEIICEIIHNFYKNEYIKCAIKEAQKNIIIYSAVFSGNLRDPDVEQIRKFMPQLKYNPPSLSTIAINVISESKKYPELNNLLGYELMGLVAYFFLGMASKVTHFDYVRASIGKMTTFRKITAKQDENASLSIQYCFQAGEALMIAKNLYFEQKHRNLVETAKYLIERTKRIAIQETTEKVTQEATKTALMNNARKALMVRHKNNIQMKTQLLEDFDRYALEKKTKGEAISKNQFAKDNAARYGVSETTIRNNWLKGYNPKI